MFSVFTQLGFSFKEYSETNQSNLNAGKPHVMKKKTKHNIFLNSHSSIQKVMKYLHLWMILNVSCISVNAYAPSNSRKNILIHQSKLGIGVDAIQNSHYSQHVNPLSIRGGSLSSITSLTKREIALSPTAASVIAGSIAGACGVGIAFPLDTLKTKSQVYGSAQSGTAIQADGSSTVVMKEDVSKMNMFQLMQLIYSLEGIPGFFGGVKGMMVGQGTSSHTELTFMILSG